MTELVERVARAISPKPWDQMSRNDRRNAMITAGLAIKEISAAGYTIVPREPTEAMLKASAETPGMQEVNGAIAFAAAHNWFLQWQDQGAEAPIIQSWRAMTDAALTDNTHYKETE